MWGAIREYNNVYIKAFRGVYAARPTLLSFNAFLTYISVVPIIEN